MGTALRFGLYVPPFGDLADARLLGALAEEAETSGWHGFFLWDHLLHSGDFAIADVWVALAAVACRTERLRLGPMVTPLPRRRPWVVAKQTATLDRLSDGRLILGVGLGSDRWREYSAFGEPADSPATRGRTADEALDVVSGLLTGEELTHRAERFFLDRVRFAPAAGPAPHVPIWVAHEWPRDAPLRRAAGQDGVFTTRADPTVQIVSSVLGKVRALRPPGRPFDMVLSGRSEHTWGASAPRELAALRDAGLTWWLERVPHDETPATIRDLIRRGPTRLDR